VPQLSNQQMIVVVMVMFAVAMNHVMVLATVLAMNQHQSILLAAMGCGVMVMKFVMAKVLV